MPDPSTQANRAAPDVAVAMRTFHRLVAFLETKSVTATAVIGGTYMLLLASSSPFRS